MEHRSISLNEGLLQSGQSLKQLPVVVSLAVAEATAWALEREVWAALLLLV